MNQQVRNVDQRCCSFETPQGEGLMSFGGVHFGDSKRGDARRTNRLVEVLDFPVNSGRSFKRAMLYARSEIDVEETS